VWPASARGARAARKASTSLYTIHAAQKPHRSGSPFECSPGETPLPHPPSQTFYKWFYSSGLKLAQKRGLGAHPSKIYGIFPSPVLTPRQLHITGYLFAVSLACACTPIAPRIFLAIGFILSLCYFPQLYAEVP